MATRPDAGRAPLRHLLPGMLAAAAWLAVVAQPVSRTTGSAPGHMATVAFSAAADAGAAHALAQSVPQAGAPVATVVGSNVTVSWNQVQMSGGTAVAGYRVRRYV